MLGLSSEELVALAAPDVAEQLLARVAALSEAQLREEIAAADCWAACQHDDFYPETLRDLPDAPAALFARGNPGLLEGLEPFGTVTIVGARRATSYGREVARELGRDLAEAGLVVASGLAFGIDACAHRGALDAGRTIAVLACGPDNAYPASHRSLWRRICEEGVVVSEFPPGASPWRWTFPARNRIMAALAGMTVVVEAAVRSGSLITADRAADLGRDLGAVPGPVTSRTSAGPNNLLAGGAWVIREAQDVLDALLGPDAKRLCRIGLPLDPDDRTALEAIEAGADTCDEVAVALDISGADAGGALGRLELLGYISRSAVSRYSRTELQQPELPAPDLTD
jgi:DNA processing protein